jgi:exopolyphosphatase/guanosine-5'-triphosphate,3'-diphosphate pyrophosphatase
MAKRTAIIDIGSNSARLVIYEKTSRYGFHLICEQKSKVRIGEGAYEKDGYLQPVGIKRAFLTLQSFLYTIEKYQVHKTICVATSALRDAPNGPDFVKWIKKKLGLSIKVIDGKKEAAYGAIAVKNLLPVQEAVTIDIGGGSADLSLIKNGKIIDTCSLNVGTVRLKELFFDKEASRKDAYAKAKAYTRQEIGKLPPHFKAALAVGIGGTARTLSKGIMKRTKYPLDKLHAFTYEIEAFKPYLEEITHSSAKGLKRFGLKKSRFDTIREGTLIWLEILSHIEAKEVMTSSVGVREGVFLEQLLKHEKLSFPKEVNPSVTSLLDRFKTYVNIASKKRHKRKLGTALYQVLQAEIEDGQQYQKELQTALRLSNIGKTLTIYKSHQHAFYIAMQELNYGFTHKEILLISLLLRMHGKELLHKPLFQSFEQLLPSKQEMLWLSFIYTLSVFLHEASNNAKIRFQYQNKTLRILSDKSLYLAKEKIKSLEKPIPFAIIIEDEEKLPKCKGLGIE